MFNLFKMKKENEELRKWNEKLDRKNEMQFLRIDELLKDEEHLAKRIDELNREKEKLIRENEELKLKNEELKLKNEELKLKNEELIQKQSEMFRELHEWYEDWKKEFDGHSEVVEMLCFTMIELEMRKEPRIRELSQREFVRWIIATRHMYEKMIQNKIDQREEDGQSMLVNVLCGTINKAYEEAWKMITAYSLLEPEE